MTYLEDKDLFLVTRNNKSYHITAEQMHEEFGSSNTQIPPIFADPLTIKSNKDREGIHTAVLSVDIDPPATGGSGVYTYEYQWIRNGNNLAVTTSPTDYTISEADADAKVDLKVIKIAKDTVTGLDSAPVESNVITAQHYYEPPECVSPTKGEEDLDPGQVVLVWTNGLKNKDVDDDAPNNTKVSVSTSADFSNAVEKDYTDTTSIKLSTHLGSTAKENQEYYWRVTNTWNTPLHSESDTSSFKTSDQQSPDATMHGLRFDSNRQTRLIKPTGAGTSWTYSGWTKCFPSGTAVINACLDDGTAGGGNDNRSNIYVRFWGNPTGTLGFHNRIGGTTSFDANINNTAIEPFKWTHVVVNYDGTTMKSWVDGNPGTDIAIAETLFEKAGYSILIGEDVPNYNPPSYQNMYQSDVYFVDGQALPPETFGKSFGGKWGPLDSDEVKSKIEYKSPEFISQFPDTHYNTSQAWSNRASGFRSSDPATRAFDGDLGTYAFSPGSSNGVSRVIFSQISGNLRVYCSMGAASPTGEVVTVTLSDGTSLTTTAADGSPTWLDFGSVTNITSISSKSTGSPSTGFALYAVELNNKILVNAPSFGANGFYLPFDPAATGVNWSNSATLTGTYNPSMIQNVFDGNLSTDSKNELHANPSSAFQTISFDTAFTSVSSVRVYGYNGDSAGTTNLGYRINTASYKNAASPGTFTYGWQDLTSQLASQGNQVSSVSMQWSGNNTNAARNGIHAIEINGKLLVDHNNIGVDDSGNENNFHDQNFAVGNTSQVWSADLTSSNGLETDRGPEKAFDGLTTTVCNTIQNGILTWLPNPGITVKSSLRLWVNDDNISYVINNGSPVPHPSEVTLGWVSFSFTGALNKLVINGAGSGAYLYAVEVDGKILIDKNIQDTVTDTPMRNYAVLNPSDNGGVTLANGNLDLSTTSDTDLTVRSDISITGGKWYWEVVAKNLDTSSFDLTSTIGITTVGSTLPSYVGSNATSWGYANHNGTKLTDGIPAPYGDTWISGDVVGVVFDADNGDLYFTKNGVFQAGGTPAFTGLTGVSYLPAFNLRFSGAAETVNFGQQPFAASNVTYDQAAGTVEIAPRYNSAQKWSDDVAGAHFSTNVPSLSFDGSTSTWSTATNGGYLTWTPSKTVTISRSLRIYAAREGTNDNITVTFDDLSTFTSFDADNTFKWYTITGAAGKTISSIKWNHNNTFSRVAVIEVDGSILVDSSLMDTSQNWSANINGDFESVRPASLGFDGTDAYTRTVTSKMAEVSWATIDNVTSLQIEAAKDSNNGSIEIQTTPGNYVDISDQFTDGQATPLMLRTITGITSISGVRLNNNKAHAQPRFSKIIVNGALLVDAGGGTFDTLYQTWSQWATTALGQAERRIDALEEQQKADQEKVSSLRSDVSDLLVRIQSIETGETSDTQYDSVLMDAIQSLTSRIEALEG